MKLKFQSHVHTIVSDGKKSLLQMAEAIRENGLDGIILTDHNAISCGKDIEDIEDKTGIMIISGIEYTTFYGHLIHIGDPVNFTDFKKDNINEYANIFKENGDIFGIAHPRCEGDPICTGCSYSFEGLDFKNVTYIEIFHDEENIRGEWDRNRSFYFKALKHNRNLRHLYGADVHDDKSVGNLPFYNEIEIKGSKDMYVEREESGDFKIDSINLKLYRSQMKRRILESIKNGNVIVTSMSGININTEIDEVSEIEKVNVNINSEFLDYSRYNDMIIKLIDDEDKIVEARNIYSNYSNGIAFDVCFSLSKSSMDTRAYFIEIKNNNGLILALSNSIS